MKIYYLLLIFLFVTTQATCQISLPSLSPVAEIKQPVGYTGISIRYGRPAARGRKIMGGLVNYGTLWRTGAGPATLIRFDTPVVINNTTVAAGTYAWLTIPGKEKWTVLLNSDTTKSYGQPDEYDIKTEKLRFDVIPEKTSRFYESLTIETDVINNDAILYLIWENTQIHFKVSTQSNTLAERNIREALLKDPGNAELYEQVADFYLMTNNLEEGLTMINKGLQIKEDRWFYHLKVEILKRQKNQAAANETITKAIAFLERTKPQNWSQEIERYRRNVNLWN